MTKEELLAKFSPKPQENLTYEQAISALEAGETLVLKQKGALNSPLYQFKKHNITDSELREIAAFPPEEFVFILKRDYKEILEKEILFYENIVYQLRFEMVSNFKA